MHRLQSYLWHDQVAAAVHAYVCRLPLLHTTASVRPLNAYRFVCRIHMMCRLAPWSCTTFAVLQVVLAAAALSSTLPLHKGLLPVTDTACQVCTAAQGQQCLTPGVFTTLSGSTIHACASQCRHGCCTLCYHAAAGLFKVISTRGYQLMMV